MTSEAAREAARALLDGARTRADVKRLAPALDADPSLRDALIEEGRRRGAELPEAALQWPAKRLLRVARGRKSHATVRSNPVARDESFVCAHCHEHVPRHGRTARDHCPHCLHSLHVDVVPGDRAADCGGLLVPVSVAMDGGHPKLGYTCSRCGAHRTNRALLDGEVPDDWASIVALSARDDRP